MKVEKLGACRGDGCFYILLRLSDGREHVAWSCHVTTAEASFPAAIYPYENEADKWVAVAPALDVSSMRIEIPSPDSSAEPVALSVNPHRLIWESRVRYRTQPDLCHSIRRSYADYLQKRFQLAVEGYYPTDDSAVWRVCASWVGSDSPSPRFAVYDGAGRRQPIDCFAFEQQRDVPLPNGLKANRSFYSLRLPKELKTFYVVCEDSSSQVEGGFLAMTDAIWRGVEHGSWLWMRDARADDELYRKWFDEHRAKPGDLELQRAQMTDGDPLFSVVVPCFHSDPSFLAQMVQSVVRQSYARWELLLIDSSPEDGVVQNEVRRWDDERIRIVSLDSNLGIVGNTNAGIAAATGDVIAFLDHDDVLEPDALFWYAKTLREKPETDVLYCDEDLFSEVDGKGLPVGGQPIFKTRLNRDLLYSHNCVTHFLAVSCVLMDRIGCSCDDVTGAQDYDLTLRALAADAVFSHVPRVLYHWREHAGSTSGDAEGGKPYAEEAGRLALERHMGEIGVAAHVETTDHPYVYRVRYDLPKSHPLVSVIIPTRDHADVLERCVMSLLERCTYDSFEIVLVENGSAESETFACYERLRVISEGRVRVEKWQGSGFNYASLINFGVSRSAGDYLLLLNNDTEVISPDLFEEMLGYLQRDDAGVVGAKLYFRDGLTQHAGVLIGPGDAVCHVNQNFPPDREGYLAKAVRPGNFSAVTGACQMVKRSVFEAVGGYDERFVVGFNDVDFCLRVWCAGYAVVFTPYAELYHYEFVSRGREAADPEKLVRWKREQALFIETWPEVFTEGDPFTNPAFAKGSQYYGLA